MANPTSVKLSKRARNGLQRTVSRDSLSDLNKPNGLQLLVPIQDGGLAEGHGATPQELENRSARFNEIEPVSVSLESLNLEEQPETLDQGAMMQVGGVHREVLRELGQGDETSDKGRLLGNKPCPSTNVPTKPKRKWWAMGGRAQCAAATRLPPPCKASRTPPSRLGAHSQPKPIPGAKPEVSRPRPQEPHVHSPSPNMEIVLNDASPKWASVPFEGDIPVLALSGEGSKAAFQQLECDDGQGATAQAQRSGVRNAAFLRKEQVSERLHHAAHRSPKKEGPVTKLVSPTLSPISYCRQDSGQEPAEVLNACGSCRRTLDSKKDIYMYQGERAFCTVSCRSRAIAKEELGQSCSAAARQGITLPMLPKLW